MDRRMVDIGIRDSSGRYKHQVNEWMNEDQATELFSLLRKQMSDFMEVIDSKRNEKGNL